MRRVPGAPGELLALSREGYACVWDPRARCIRAVSLNGALAAAVASPPDEGPLAAMAISADGRMLVTGSTPDPMATVAATPGVGRVVLRAVPSLRELYRFAIPEGCVLLPNVSCIDPLPALTPSLLRSTGVTSVLLLEGDTMLLVGTNSGATLVCALQPALQASTRRSELTRALLRSSLRTRRRRHRGRCVRLRLARSASR